MSDIEMTAYQIMAETGLSARELAEMDMDAYARATRRPTPTQAALQALNGPETATPGQEPAGAPQPLESRPEGVDVSQLTMEQYAALRGRLGSGRSATARGIFGN